MSSSTPAEERDRRARSFASATGEYERGRPGYPREAIQWLLGPEPLEVVDLGAGTGKLSRAILAAGHRVRAIEPLAEMRSVLAVTTPGALAIEGSAESIPLADRSADAVVAGAAFHWFDHERALSETARVLREPGVLGLLGNRLDASVPWMETLRGRLGSRGGRHVRWPAPERLEQIFDEVSEREFPHEQSVDLQGLRDFAVSRSGVILMEPAERERLLEDLGRLWQEHVGQERGTLSWRTRVLRARVLRSA